MREKIGTILLLCVMLSWLGCPVPVNPTGYEGPWLVAFDWDCNNMGGEAIFTLREDGSLSMVDLSLDNHKTDALVAYGSAGEVDPLEWTARQYESDGLEKYRFEGEWGVDEATGQLVMVVRGFDVVRYKVTRQMGNIYYGDMYVGNFYNGCFQMQREN